ncbi:MAG: hypothetical protein WC335_07345 [Candidatus Omnitrophota bacterium]
MKYNARPVYKIFLLSLGIVIVGIGFVVIYLVSGALNFQRKELVPALVRCSQLTCLAQESCCNACMIISWKTFDGVPAVCVFGKFPRYSFNECVRNREEGGRLAAYGIQSPKTFYALWWEVTRLPVVLYKLPGDYADKQFDVRSGCVQVSLRVDGKGCRAPALYLEPEVREQKIYVTVYAEDPAKCRGSYGVFRSKVLCGFKPGRYTFIGPKDLKIENITEKQPHNPVPEGQEKGQQDIFWMPQE